MYDVVIIGAGVCGSLIARELSKYKLKVIVIDKENDVANGTSMANSAIIHSGHDPKDGTIKKTLNKQGNALYEALSKELQFQFVRCGAFVAATTEEEVEHLEQMYKQTQLREIACEMLTREQAASLEPNLSSEVLMCLSLPSTAIVYPWEVCIAAMENAIDNGVELRLNEKVINIVKIAGGYKVVGLRECFNTKLIINASGVYSEQVAKMVNPELSFSIRPRIGEYYVLDHASNMLVNRVIYPMPSSKGKGILVVPTVSRNILLGPTSDEVENMVDVPTTYEGLSKVREGVKKVVTNIPMQNNVRTFAGLRATSNTHDFIIEEMPGFSGFINVAGIDSPGLASAPAIALKVVDELVASRLTLERKINFNPNRRGFQSLKKMSNEERNAFVQQNPAYGKIVCRCEQVSEGEILDAINRPAGARTVKAVKKRVRPGMGRCQGGFCEPHVVEILARALNVSPLEINYDAEGTQILMEETKVGGNR
ncbi:MAG: NAD(P)/FAD-dependent oxidoreductase [Erysipelotrichaceae bacterium]